MIRKTFAMMQAADTIGRIPKLSKPAANVQTLPAN